MRSIISKATVSAMIGIAGAGVARAQTDVPAGVHTVSENWTLAGSPYRLKGQVYFSNNSTLTIDAGVVIASLPADGGSLAICRGSQIFVNGTQDQPVIMTSTNDVATWSGTTGSGSSQIPGDPKTGTWRAAANEWGNLTIMGAAYISENAVPGNTAAPSATNVANMEGLTNGPSTDQYGGGNDDDDSGSVSYLSLRYGGKVVALNVELNGLSLGGLGRETELDHIDIMNNVDDGIEIWGGTVNLKYVNIWNVGDDSFDVDQGWRGKAQFGLIVQGYSLIAAQGSGVGDNVFETDGAEQSDYQPVTTACIYNFTVIGQPAPGAGDHATAWRDNARVQYRNCIFMDLGDRLVSFDNVDGDGGQGYGFNGTLSWANTWTTAFNVTSTVNPFTNRIAAYQAQTSGKLAEITDSVVFRNLSTDAYTEANNRAVFAAANNNVSIPGTADADAPIRSITRGTPVAVFGGTSFMLPVIGLDPRPKNAAMTSVNAAPDDGFFTPAQYRGAFVPKGQSWLCDWTASFAFGYTTDCDPGYSFCVPGVDANPCPCFTSAGQVADPNHGCGNSVFNGGAHLAASGVADTANDTLHFVASDVPAGVGTIFLQGVTNIAPGVALGDGIRCAGGQLTRLGLRIDSDFDNVTELGFNTGDSISALGFVSGGDTRVYQTYYRNPNAGWCPPQTFNITQAWSIAWR